MLLFGVKMADFMNCLCIQIFLGLLLMCPSQDCAVIEDSRKSNVSYLQPGLVLEKVNPMDLELFCFLGRRKSLLRVWETARVKLITNIEHFDYYVGATLDDVLAAYDAHQNSWSLIGFASKSTVVHLNPFNQSFIGIHSHHRRPFGIELIEIRVDFWRVLMVFGGIILFFAAPRLSKNNVFYFICGIAAGICASFLIAIYFFSKLLPQKPLMFGVLIGGWTVSVYFVQLLWENFRTVFEQYGTHVLAYIISTGIISFGVCYRFGPVTDPRSRNLIKWTLQIAALVLILLSSWHQEASVSLALILLVIYIFPSSWISILKTYWRRRFPPSINLISEDEYHEQGIIETQKALHGLRAYCSSPECDAWKTVLKIKNPVRFAGFMSGNSHLTDTEILAYDSESRHQGATETDSEECSSNEEEEEESY